MRSKKLELLREQEVNEKWNKKKVTYVRWWSNNILEKLDANLTALIT